MRSVTAAIYFVVGTLILLLWLWCLAALAYHPWLPVWGNMAAVVSFLVLTGYFVWLVYGRRSVAGQRAIDCFCAAAFCILIFMMLPSPTHNRKWASAQATRPSAAIDGYRVLVKNMRRTNPQSVEHYDKTFDLQQLESVWFGVQYFSAIQSLAHTFVSFGFADGEYLTISIESRRGKGEGFSPVAGMFRNYGTIYVLGDELEIIGSRSALDKNAIYIYPIKASAEQRGAMLIDMLTRTNELTEQPEFYDTWTNNCTNNIVVHFNKVAPIYISPYDPRVVFPGYTARVAYKNGLIDSEGTLEEIQARALIGNRGADAQTAKEFSQAIRAGYVEY